MNNIKSLPIIALLAATAVWAGDDAATMERPSFHASQTMMVSAVVEEINHETRVVTVRKPDGEALTFTASEEARNRSSRSHRRRRDAGFRGDGCNCDHSNR